VREALARAAIQQFIAAVGPEAPHPLSRGPALRFLALNIKPATISFNLLTNVTEEIQSFGI
jgi:hypothetical protein